MPDFGWMNLFENELRRAGLGQQLDSVKSGWGRVMYTKKIAFRAPGETTSRFVEHAFPVNFIVQHTNKGREIRFTGDVTKLASKISSNPLENFYLLRSHRELQLQIAETTAAAASFKVSDILENVGVSAANAISKKRGLKDTTRSERIMVKAVADPSIPLHDSNLDSMISSKVSMNRAKRTLYYGLVPRGGGVYELHLNPAVGHFENFDFDGDMFEFIRLINEGDPRKLIAAGVKFPSLFQGAMFLSAESMGWSPDKILSSLGTKKITERTLLASFSKGVKLRTPESEILSAAKDKEMVGVVNNLLMLHDLYLAQTTIENPTENAKLLQRFLKEREYKIFGSGGKQIATSPEEVLLYQKELMAAINGSVELRGAYLYEAKTGKQSGMLRDIIEDAIKAVTQGPFHPENYPELQSLLGISTAEKFTFLSTKRMPEASAADLYDYSMRVFEGDFTSRVLEEHFMAGIANFKKVRNKPFKGDKPITKALVRNYGFATDKVVTSTQDVFSGLVMKDNNFNLIQIHQLGSTGAIGVNTFNKEGFAAPLAGSRNLITNHEVMAIIPNMRVYQNGQVKEVAALDWLRTEFNARAAKAGLNFPTSENLLTGEFDPANFLGSETLSEKIAAKLFPDFDNPLVPLRSIASRMGPEWRTVPNQGVAELKEAVRLYHARTNQEKTAALLRDIVGKAGTQTRVKRNGDGTVQFIDAELGKYAFMRGIDLGVETNNMDWAAEILKSMAPNGALRMHKEKLTRFGLTDVRTDQTRVNGTRRMKIQQQEMTPEMLVNVVLVDSDVADSEKLLTRARELGIPDEEVLAQAQNGVLFMSKETNSKINNLLLKQGNLTGPFSREKIEGFDLPALNSRGEEGWTVNFEEIFKKQETIGGFKKILTSDSGIKNLAPTLDSSIDFTTKSEALRTAAAGKETLVGSLFFGGETKAVPQLLAHQVEQMEQAGTVFSAEFREKVDRMLKLGAARDLSNKQTEEIFKRDYISVAQALMDLQGSSLKLNGKVQGGDALVITNVGVAFGTTGADLGIPSKAAGFDLTDEFEDNPYENVKHPTQMVDLISALRRGFANQWGEEEGGLTFDKFYRGYIEEAAERTDIGRLLGNATAKDDYKAFVENIFAGTSTVAGSWKRHLPPVDRSEKAVSNLANDLRAAVKGVVGSTSVTDFLRELY